MSKYLGSIARRSLLASAAGLGLAGGLFSNLRVATAQPLTGAPAEVDRLAVRVLTDSYLHAMEPSGKSGDVAIQRSVYVLSGKLPRTLQNEWGLALHLESARGSEARQFLVDFGFTGDTLNNNIALLGVDPAKLDALLLTHGHYDHFGGIVGFLAPWQEAEAGPAVLPWGGRVLLHPRGWAREHALLVRIAGPQGDCRCRPSHHVCRGAINPGGARLHHRAHPPGVFRETRAADPHASGPASGRHGLWAGRSAVSTPIT